MEWISRTDIKFHQSRIQIICNSRQNTPEIWHFICFIPKTYNSLTEGFFILSIICLWINSFELKRLDSFEFQRLILRLRWKPGWCVGILNICNKSRLSLLRRPACSSRGCRRLYERGGVSFRKWWQAPPLLYFLYQIDFCYINWWTLNLWTINKQFLGSCPIRLTVQHSHYIHFSPIHRFWIKFRRSTIKPFSGEVRPSVVRVPKAFTINPPDSCRHLHPVC